MEDISQICNQIEKEVYQLDFEVCYDCWMKQTSPEIWVYSVGNKLENYILGTMPYSNYILSDWLWYSKEIVLSRISCPLGISVCIMLVQWQPIH